MSESAADILFQEEIYSIAAKPVVLLQQPWEALSDEEKQLLTKIIAALKTSLDAIVIKSQPVFDLSTWKQKPSRLIYFGEVPKGIPYYEVVQSDGVALVAAASLKDLLPDDAARKQLWGALKQLFLL